MSQRGRGFLARFPTDPARQLQAGDDGIHLPEYSLSESIHALFALTEPDPTSSLCSSTRAFIPFLGTLELQA